MTVSIKITNHGSGPIDRYVPVSIPTQVARDNSFGPVLESTPAEIKGYLMSDDGTTRMYGFSAPTGGWPAGGGNYTIQNSTSSEPSFSLHPAWGTQGCGENVNWVTDHLPRVRLFTTDPSTASYDINLRDINNKGTLVEESGVHRLYHVRDSIDGWHVDYFFRVWRYHQIGDYWFTVNWTNQTVPEIDTEFRQVSLLTVGELESENMVALGWDKIVYTSNQVVRYNFEGRESTWSGTRFGMARDLAIKGQIFQRLGAGDPETDFANAKTGEIDGYMSAADWEGYWGVFGAVPEVPTDTTVDHSDMTVARPYFGGAYVGDGGNAADYSSSRLCDEMYSQPNTKGSGGSTPGGYGMTVGGDILSGHTPLRTAFIGCCDMAARALHCRHHNQTGFTDGDPWDSFADAQTDFEGQSWRLWPVSESKGRRRFGKGDTNYAGTMGDTRLGISDAHAHGNHLAVYYLLTKDPLVERWIFGVVSQLNRWCRIGGDRVGSHLGRNVNATSNSTQAGRQLGRQMLIWSQMAYASPAVRSKVVAMLAEFVPLVAANPAYQLIGKTAGPCRYYSYIIDSNPSNAGEKTIQDFWMTAITIQGYYAAYLTLNRYSSNDTARDAYKDLFDEVGEYAVFYFTAKNNSTGRLRFCYRKSVRDNDGNFIYESEIVGGSSGERVSYVDSRISDLTGWDDTESTVPDWGTYTETCQPMSDGFMDWCMGSVRLVAANHSDPATQTRAKTVRDDRVAEWGGTAPNWEASCHGAIPETPLS